MRQSSEQHASRKVVSGLTTPTDAAVLRAGWMSGEATEAHMSQHASVRLVCLASANYVIFDVRNARHKRKLRH